MDKTKFFYWTFSIIILIEVLNLIFKVINQYYFNLTILGLLTLSTFYLGKIAGIKIGVIVTFAVITLLLIGLMTFVVWN